MTGLAIPPDIRFGVGGFPLAFTERPEAKDRGAVFAEIWAKVGDA